MKRFVGLSPCPRHASGNVGDQLTVEVSQDIIEEVHGPVEFDVYFKREDLTSRLDRINEADAVILFGLEILREGTRPRNYRIAEDLDAVEPPIIADSSSYSFYPGDEYELARQVLGERTRTFLDRVRKHCPDGTIPVRDDWVGRVLEQNGYETVLTGDPGWFDLDMIGEAFHEPASIDQLVLTPPRSALFVDQARELIRRLGSEFPGARRVVSLHSAPTDVDRTLCETARADGWEVRYASHETSNIGFYRNSDLHVGYRLHGHLAHLRLRRPSVVLAEDARAMGLTETFGTAGIPAFSPRDTSGVGGLIRRASDTIPVTGLHLLLNKMGYTDVIPRDSPLKGSVNAAAVDQVMGFIHEQFATGWNAYDRIREVIDRTYRDGVKPYWQAALNE